MFNLTEIMHAAQNGQGIANLASQFGLSPEQAQAAVKALMPGMSMGLQNQATNTDGLSSIINMMTGGAHQEAFNNPEATVAPQTVNAGTDVLNQIFGGQAGAEAVAKHAANLSGISSAVMQSMMPVIASMVMGGLFKGASNSGLGSLLGAATGGGAGNILTNILSQFAAANSATVPAAAPVAAAQGGMMGGLLGGIMGSLMGAQIGSNQASPNQAALPQQPATPAANPMAAGLEMLQSMMNHGQQVQAGHTNALQDILNSMIKK